MTINRIINKLKRSSIDSLFTLGLENKIFPELKGKSIILMYHGVDKIQNKKYNLRFIGIKNLEKQLLYLKNKFNVLPLKDYMDNINVHNKFSICITFDDGYNNNFKYVYPLLEEHQIPATFFITSIKSVGEDILWADFFDIFTSLNHSDLIIDENTSFKKINGKYYYNNSNKTLNEFVKEIGDFNRIKQIMTLASENIENFKLNPLFDDYWKLMSDLEIKQISKSKYITIGSHAIYHNRLDLISKDELIDQLTSSKSYLENIIGKEVNALAYPCGYYSKDVIDIAEKIGYKYQLTDNYPVKKILPDKRVEGRLGIYPAYSWRNLIYEMVISET